MGFEVSRYGVKLLLVYGSKVQGRSCENIGRIEASQKFGDDISCSRHLISRKREKEKHFWHGMTLSFMNILVHFKTYCLSCAHGP